jgi:hypothetical protein
MSVMTEVDNGFVADQSLNLTVARGPSVWAKPRRASAGLAAATITGAAVFIGCAWALRSRTNRALAAAGLFAVALGLASDAASGLLNRLRGLGASALDDSGDDEVDRASKASFPASDPPSH